MQEKGGRGSERICVCEKASSSFSALAYSRISVICQRSDNSRERESSLHGEKERKGKIDSIPSTRQTHIFFFFPLFFVPEKDASVTEKTDYFCGGEKRRRKKDSIFFSGAEVQLLSHCRPQGAPCLSATYKRASEMPRASLMSGR